MKKLMGVPREDPARGFPAAALSVLFVAMKGHAGGDAQEGVALVVFHKL